MSEPKLDVIRQTTAEPKMELWPRSADTGILAADAMQDWLSWGKWMEEKRPGVLDQLGTLERAELYTLFYELAEEIQRLRR